MVIFRYSGNIYTILRTFLGLNQRLNQILIDKRLNLFTDLLHINIRNDYYNSDIFQQVSQQLLSINTTINEQQLSQLLQSLITFHIKQKYIQLGYEFQTAHAKFISIRQQLTNDTIHQVDHQLKIQFDSLYNGSVTMECINRIKSLILTEGARLVCEDSELSRFNLTKAVNNLFLCHINKPQYKPSPSINSHLDLFKTLLVSNTSLIKNKDYVGSGGCNLEYFLVYTLYQLLYFYHGSTPMPVNMEYYRATVDLLLFVIQCQKQTFENVDNLRRTIYHIVEMSPKINKDMFIQTAQWEILKIVVGEYVRRSNEPWNDNYQCMFRSTLRHLMKNRRLDVIVYVSQHIEFRRVRNESNFIRECLDLVTSNRSERQFFCRILEDQPLDLLFPKASLIFILLDKKERILIEKVLKLSPCLIHQLDEDGNDPLLYICLKVHGCRHRIIEFLIKMGSDLQRRNIKGENFMEVLQLQKNQKLLQKLIEHEIIQT